jgi:hypothetical protein
MKFFILLLSVCFIAISNNSAAQNVAAKSIKPGLYISNQDNAMLLADNISAKPVSDNNNIGVVDNEVDFKLSNMPKGVYNVKLETSFGQLIVKESINYDGVTDMQTIHFDKKIARGAYKLEVFKPGSTAGNTCSIEY